MSRRQKRRWRDDMTDAELLAAREELRQVYNEQQARIEAAEHRAIIWEIVRPVVWAMSLLLVSLAGAAAGTLWPMW